MIRAVAGIFRNGEVHLSEVPPDVAEYSRVIVTFLEQPPISLEERVISEEHAHDLRTRLACFGADWDNPDMSIYDDYDAAKSTL
jgi:hypothetical protein